MFEDIKDEFNGMVFSALSPKLESLYKKYSESLSLDDFKLIVLDEKNYIEQHDKLSIAEIDRLLNKIKVSIRNYLDEPNDNSVRAYLNEICRYKLLSPEESKDLLKRIKEGDLEAKDKFIKANLRLVVLVAKKYGYNNDSNYLDYLQEGCFGLMRAVDNYNLEYGTSFSTYAMFWIRQAMYKNRLKTSREIRIPSYMYSKIKAFNNARDSLKKILGREPSIDELAIELHENKTHVIKYYELTHMPISLDQPVTDDSELYVRDVIKDNNFDMDEIIADKSRSSDIRKYIDKLNVKDIHKEILYLRFGFKDNKKYTLQELSNIYGVSRQRIQQIVDDTLNKIINNDHLSELAIYADNITMAEKQAKCIKICRDSKAYRYTFDKFDIKPKRKKQYNKDLTEIFEGYSKEDIRKVIDRLADKDRKLLKLKFGEDYLDNPVNNNLDGKIKVKFYRELLPVIKKMLDNPDMVRVTKMGSTDREIEKMLKNKEKYECDNDKSITLSNYLRSKTFEDMLKCLSKKEVIVLSLSLGFIEEQCFSNETIAAFLNMKQDDVRNTLKKAMSIYKEKIIENMDNIEDIADQRKRYLKNRNKGKA